MTFSMNLMNQYHSPQNQCKCRKNACKKVTLFIKGFTPFKSTTGISKWLCGICVKTLLKLCTYVWISSSTKTLEVLKHAWKIPRCHNCLKHVFSPSLLTKRSQKLSKKVKSSTTHSYMMTSILPSKIGIEISGLPWPLHTHWCIDFIFVCIYKICTYVCFLWNSILLT